MPRLVVVVDDLFGLPGTSGIAGVLEGRYFASGGALCRPHHPLENPAVADSAIAIPGGGTAGQDAVNCASVQFCEGFRCQAKFLQPPSLHCLCGLTISVWQ